jgi:pyruvate formate lyase activating enzyme
VRYAYTGNVVDPDGDTTLCHECGQLLIGRNWYTLTAWELTPELECPSCGTACAGVLERQPGTWGAKRQPVFIGG